MEFGVVMTGAAQTVSEFNSANHWQIGYVVLMTLTVILLMVAVTFFPWVYQHLIWKMNHNTEVSMTHKQIKSLRIFSWIMLVLAIICYFGGSKCSNVATDKYVATARLMVTKGKTVRSNQYQYVKRGDTEYYVVDGQQYNVANGTGGRGLTYNVTKHKVGHGESTDIIIHKTKFNHDLNTKNRAKVLRHVNMGGCELAGQIDVWE